MDLTALWVTVGGVALAVGVNLYFFAPRRAVVAQPAAPEPAPPAAPETPETRESSRAPEGAPPVAETPVASGPQEVHITVRGGYDPARIEVRAGRTARIVFRREEVEGCSDTVLIPEWGIARRLPAGMDTAVEFMPTVPGEYAFTCGMGMMRGTIVVV